MAGVDIGDGGGPAHLDLAHEIGVLADQVLGARIARELHHLREEAARPQHRIAALAGDRRHADRAALDGTEGGDQPIWFSVEEDDGRLELAMWVTRKDVSLKPGDQYVVDGVTFHESERGRASYTTEGTTGLPPGGEMEFVDCANSDESALLSFERWAADMPWEVSTGKSVSPGEITVYPAPPPSPA